jgi:hypothetical protein
MTYSMAAISELCDSAQTTQWHAFEGAALVAGVAALFSLS